MRISDWSSDVCSSDLVFAVRGDITTGSDNLFKARGSVDLPITDSLSAIVSFGVQTRDGRSEERRVGKECVSTCRSRWWRYHKQKKDKYSNILSTYLLLL